MHGKLKLHSKGFVFSLEATIALLLFVLMLVTLPTPHKSSLKELLIVEQENDLLKVWSAKETNESEMIKDAKQLFGENFELWTNETQLTKTIEKRSSISSEGVILDEFLNEKKVKIIVNYD